MCGSVIIERQSQRARNIVVDGVSRSVDSTQQVGCNAGSCSGMRRGRLLLCARPTRSTNPTTIPNKFSLSELVYLLPNANDYYFTQDRWEYVRILDTDDLYINILLWLAFFEPACLIFAYYTYKILEKRWYLSKIEIFLKL